MSFAYTCDWCAKVIGEDERRATLELRVELGVGSYTEREEAKARSGYVSHYHHEDCWPAMRDRIRLAEEYSSIEAIPTLSGQAVAARRRKHNRPPEVT